MNQSTLRLARKSLAGFMMAATSVCVPAGAETFELPPLGLYRIDTDGTMTFNGNPAEVRITTDGATGNTASHHRMGAHSAAREFKGTGPVTHCVKAITGGTLPLPPQAGACRVDGSTKTKDGFVQSASCPFGKLDQTVRQLDRDR